jgi:hypothetical protein
VELDLGGRPFHLSYLVDSIKCSSSFGRLITTRLEFGSFSSRIPASLILLGCFYPSRERIFDHLYVKLLSLAKIGEGITKAVD